METIEPYPNIEASALDCRLAIEWHSYTPLAGCGAYGVDVYVHPVLVNPAAACLASAHRCRVCTSGRLRPTRFVAQVDDSKTMG